MVQVESEHLPIGTSHHVQTDESEFANALYELALKAGHEVEAGDVVGRLHSFDLAASDEELGELIQAAYALAFEREAAIWEIEQAMRQVLVA